MNPTNDFPLFNNFKLREYQKPIYDAIFLEGKRKVIACLPRRAGKDLMGFNLAILQCLLKPCLVMYVLPVFNQARGTVMDALTIDGQRFLDYLPMSHVYKINSHEMKIIFINNSILQLVGGETHKTSIRGRNPFAVILSEYAYFESGEVLDTVSPILAANKGWLLILSTPWGKNHFFQLCEYAKQSEHWLYYARKTSEINHVPLEALEIERARMSPEKFAQEYEISFSSGVEGTYYGRALERIRQKGQINSISWDPGLLVHLAIDIGVNDATSIVFFQSVGNGSIIRIIDCYSNTGLGLDHYAKLIQDKPYRYGKMFAPHDIAVREWGGGAVTRHEKALQLGLNFEILPQTDLMDGIDNVLTHFPKFWIDSHNCKPLIDALENYRKQKNDKKSINADNPFYENRPAHNWASHYADCVRYMCQGLHLTADIRPAEDYDNIRNQALYGKNTKLPKIFQHDPRYDR
jgi:phage terminase large subunit